MGQYYLIANMNKRELLCVNGKHPGLKLLEIAANKNDSLALINQMAESWKGDSVFLIGDYADLSSDDVTYFKTLQIWTDKLHLNESLYNYVRDNFKNVEGDIADKGYRFLYNHDNKVYIDLLHIPTSKESTYEKTFYFSPLPLLIAMGNGRGGGDYLRRNNDKFVGSWCDSISSVEITKEPKDELGYSEFHPDFS